MSEFKFRENGAASGERLYSVAEVAAYTQLAPRTVYRTIARGELRAFRVARRLRVAQSDIVEWLEQSRTSGAEPETGDPSPAPLRRAHHGRLRPLFEAAA